MNQKQMRNVTIALMLGNVMSGLDSTVINTALPVLISDLHGIQFMGWVIATYLLGMSISIPIWTKFGEKFSYKKTFTLAISFFALGSALQGVAPNIYLFLIARLLMGWGAGGIGSLPYIIMGLVFENLNQRTKSLSYLTASYNMAAIMGPLVGGWLIETLSWRWVFYLNIPIGLLVFILWNHSFVEITERVTTKFDTKGAIYLSFSLLCFLTGIQMIGLTTNILVITLVVVGLLFLLGFIRQEKYAENPVIPLEIFHNAKLNGDFALFILTWGVFVAINTYLPMWAQTLLGTTALIGGMTLIPNSLLVVISSQTVSFFQARLRTFTMIMVGLITMLISVLGLYLGTLHTPLWLLTMVAAVSGIGVSFIFIALQVKVQTDAGPQYLATATSTSFLLRILAQTTMAAIYGVLMNLSLNYGISQHQGITITMMNKLSNATVAQTLPTKLLPTMHAIFHSGIRSIMLFAIILVLCAMLANVKYNWKSND